MIQSYDLALLLELCEVDMSYSWLSYHVSVSLHMDSRHRQLGYLRIWANYHEFLESNKQYPSHQLAIRQVLL